MALLLAVACCTRAPISPMHGGAAGTANGADGDAVMGGGGSAVAGDSSPGSSGSGSSGSSGGTTNAAGAGGGAGSAGASGEAGFGIGGSFGGEVLPSQGWVNWTAASLSPQNWPSARRSLAMANDDDGGKNAGKIYVYGGYSNALPCATPGNGMARRHLDAARRLGAGRVRRNGRRRRHDARSVILFGGESYPSAAPSNAVWRWSVDESHWTSLAITSAMAPVPRVGAVSAFDYLGDSIFIHGAQGNVDTWELDPVAGAWTNVTPPPGKGPVGPGGDAFAWDLRRNVGVLFGGVTGNEVWEFDGTSGMWTNYHADPNGTVSWPTPRRDAGLTAAYWRARSAFVKTRILAGRARRDLRHSSSLVGGFRVHHRTPDWPDVRVRLPRCRLRSSGRV